MADELVSVVVPTWQRAGFIDRCLDGILSQGVDVEVLVVDDGSTDDTKQRVEARDDPRVRFFAEPHGGLPAIVRNVGLRNARGRLVAFCDSDDAWLPGKLARSVEAARRVPDATVIATRVRLVTPAGKDIGEFPDARDASDDVGLARLIAGNVVPCSASLVRRDDALAVGGFPEDPRAKAVEDYGLWLALARRGKVVVRPELDVMHERHEGSLSMNGEVREASGILYLLSNLEGPDVPRAAVATTRRYQHSRLARVAWEASKKGEVSRASVVTAAWHSLRSKV